MGDIRQSAAYKITTDLQHEGKLDSDKQILNRAFMLRQKFKRLHQIVILSFENEKDLLNKARELRNDLTKHQYKLGTVSQQQSQTALSLQRLTKTFQQVTDKQTQNELDHAEQRVQVIQWEVNQLEQDRNEAFAYLSQREQEQQAKLVPKIQRFQDMIASLKQEIQEYEQRVQKEKVLNGELQETITGLTGETDKLQEEMEYNSLTLSKSKGEPLRFQKNADILDNAINRMEADLHRVQSQLEVSNGDITKYNVDKEVSNLELAKLKEELANQKEDYDKIKKEKDEIKRKKEDALEEQRNIRESILQFDMKLKSLDYALKRESDHSQELGKQLYKLKKEYKKYQVHQRQINTQLIDINQQLKEAQQIHSVLNIDSGRQKEIIDNLQDQHAIMSKTTLDKEQDQKVIQVKIEDVKKQIEEAEQKAKKKRSKQSKLVKEMERLSLKREYMAREASQKVAQARQTAEQLKTKQLFVIDLKKKIQQTDFNIRTVLVMYDQVKNARNKYVELIQNSSQQLAETKQRIKILQNQVQILRNQSAQKQRKLKQQRHNVQLSLHHRDGLRMNINKLDYNVKQQESLVIQQVNQTNKLTDIIKALQKEMQDLKVKYQQVCQSRNYTGIQLIDRNDQLCILYQKSNIQQNIQKKGESEIRAQQDDIRMLNLQLAQVKRQIEVVRKQIPNVPILASQVIALQSELMSQKEKEKKLADQLQDPFNANRYHQLKGEDPDQQALQAKIQVLQQRLNNKKEQLLQKELVFQQITNLADKLRAQALTGRQSTLQLAQKVNEFQARIKSLTRKMMATVSQLSMYQATSLKLQQEKTRLEDIEDSAIQRVKQGLPPLEDREKEWEKMEKHRIMQAQERQARLMREEEEKSLVGAVTQSTAEPRLLSYVPDDGIGLPRPYGQHPPFGAYSVGLEYEAL